MTTPREVVAVWIQQLDVGLRQRLADISLSISSSPRQVMRGPVLGRNRPEGYRSEAG